MARERKEIQAEIIEEINNKLPELNSQSATAVWRLWTYVISMAIWTFEKILDIFKEDIEEIILNNRVGTAMWYSRLSKDFQYGYDLESNEYGQYYYNVKDDDSKIIKACSVVRNDDGGIDIKVAKENSKGEFTELLEDEREKFEYYINRVSIIGTKTNVVSFDSDKLYLDIEIYTSPLLDKSKVEAKVKEKIKEFLKVLTFDGELLVNSLRENIRELKEVEDIDIKKTSVYEGDEEKEFKRVYNSKAGYISLKDNSIIKIVNK